MKFFPCQFAIARAYAHTYTYPNDIRKYENWFARSQWHETWETTSHTNILHYMAVYILAQIQKKHSHCSELLLVGWKIAGIFVERICMLEIKVCLRYTVIVYSIQWFWYAYMDVEKKKKTVMRRIELICCTVYQHRNVS